MEHYNYFHDYRKGNDEFFMPMKGLVHGNMSVNLYDPYSKYLPKNLPTTKENEIRAYIFAIIDLGLLLDINPNDTRAKKLFDEYLSRLKVLKKDFNDKYYALDLDDVKPGNVWTWLNNNPWEVRNV